MEWGQETEGDRDDDVAICMAEDDANDDLTDDNAEDE